MKVLKYTLAALAATTLAASAALIPLGNASLDSAIVGGTWTEQTSNWQAFPGRLSAGGITTTSLAANDGSAYGSLDSTTVGPLAADGDSIYQNVALTSGQEYKMTIAVATSSTDNSDTADTTYAIAVYSSGYGAEVAGSAWQTIAADGDTWTDFSFTWTADATANFNIGVRNYTDLADGEGTLYVDNVRFESIPEPATLGLVAVFGGGVLFIRRKLMM